MPYWFDGNNLMGQSAATAREDRHTRKEFLSMLSTCQKSGGGRFLVYFDGDDPAGSVAPSGISIRYSAPDSADAAILGRLRDIQHPAEIIVVTNDLELMARCRNAGAQALNWRQFTSKMQTRPPAPLPLQKPSQEQVDVAEWMRYFGIDNTDP